MTIYSIEETAEENGLNPFNSLTCLLEQLRNSDCTDPMVDDHLLPMWAELQHHARMSDRKHKAF